MNVWKQAVRLYIGGMGYVALELLWRGWSHGSMFLVGGICFLLISTTETLSLPLLPRSVLCAVLVTAVELVSGLLINVALGLRVWDYGGVPYNLWGQICLPYFFLWTLVSAGAVLIDRALRRALFREPPVPWPGVLLPAAL